MEDKKVVDVFTADENKTFGELRLNAIMESIARQRDQAFNSAARAESELAVKNSQVELLSNKVTAQAAMMGKLIGEIQSLREELSKARTVLAAEKAAEKNLEVPEVPAETEVTPMLDESFGDIE